MLWLVGPGMHRQMLLSYQPVNARSTYSHPKQTHFAWITEKKKKKLFYSEIRPIKTKWRRPAVEEEEEARGARTQLSHAHIVRGTKERQSFILHNSPLMCCFFLILFLAFPSSSWHNKCACRWKFCFDTSVVLWQHFLYSVILFLPLLVTLWSTQQQIGTFDFDFHILLLPLLKCFAIRGGIQSWIIVVAD